MNSKVISGEQKQKLINDLIDFYETERNEKIGVIAATELLEFLVSTLGVNAYNNGILESQTFFKKKMEELDVDLGASLLQSE